MSVFSFLTPLIYWLLALLWTFIFVFYLRKLFHKGGTDKFLRILLLILAVDAFRTLLESFYFGAWFTSLSGWIPIFVYDFLAQPQIVFIPKLINLFASLFVITIILKRWLPQEALRIDIFNRMLKERTKSIEESNQKYQQEANMAVENAKQYQKATINSPLPIMIHADDGQVIMISDSWTKITGYTLGDINTIEKWNRHAYGFDVVELSEYMDKLYEIEEPIKEGAFTIYTKAGEKRIWEFSSAPLDVLPYGRRLIITTAIDITEKTLSENELNEYRSNLEKIIKNRTIELEAKNTELKKINIELEEYNQLFVDREFRINALKLRISELEKGLQTD